MLVIGRVCMIFDVAVVNRLSLSSYTVRREGAIWHLLGCQILVQKTTPQMVPIGTLILSMIRRA